MIAAGLFVVWILALLILTRPLFCLVVFVIVCCCCAPGQQLAVPTEQQHPQQTDDDVEELDRALKAFVKVCADTITGEVR